MGHTVYHSDSSLLLQHKSITDSTYVNGCHYAPTRLYLWIKKCEFHKTFLCHKLFFCPFFPNSLRNHSYPTCLIKTDQIWPNNCLKLDDPYSLFLGMKVSKRNLWKVAVAGFPPGTSRWKAMWVFPKYVSYSRQDLTVTSVWLLA